jgi:peroxiredoxin
MRPIWILVAFRDKQSASILPADVRVEACSLTAFRPDLKIRFLLCLLAVVFLTAGPGRGEQPLPGELGLPVGQHAPAFTLPDQNGNQVSLTDLLKVSPVALVFFRSADWCLACDVELIQLQRNLKRIESTGTRLVGISYDPPKTLKCFADKKSITFPVLSDPDSKIIDAYHVRDGRVPRSKDGTAAHITIVLDQNGVIRAKLAQVIHTEFDLEALVKMLNDVHNVKGGTPQ